MVRCQNCGHLNENDATFCEKCGTNLESKVSSKTFPGDQIKKEEGMAQSTKLLIIICIILVAGLGITAGALIQMNKGDTTVINNSTVTQSPTQVTNQESWHEVNSFSGTSDGSGNFNIKGKMYKIVMTANPQLNYNTNSMTVDVSDSNNNLITTGNIQWTPTEAISQKEKTIQITGTPGSCSMIVSANALQNWTVDVYDYY
jgi:hypothetical protein